MKAQDVNSSRVQFQSRFLVPSCHPGAHLCGARGTARRFPTPTPPSLVWKGGPALLGQLSPPQPVSHSMMC